MKQPNAVRGFGPLDNILSKLRHNIAYRKLKKHQPINRCLDIGSGNYPIFLINFVAHEKYGLETGRLISFWLVNNIYDL